MTLQDGDPVIEGLLPLEPLWGVPSEKNTVDVKISHTISHTIGPQLNIKESRIETLYFLYEK